MELEFASLLMCDILPKNYTDQVILLNATSTLDDEEIKKMFGLFDIIIFINPKAIQALLEDKILLQKYASIHGKTIQI